MMPASKKNGVNLPRWLWWMICAVMVALIGGTQQAVSTLINHESRISVNESNMDRLTRIETKLDRLIEK